MLLLVLLYFTLTFALYSSLYAAAGVLVQRQDEAQHASTPVTILFVIGYIVSLSIVSIPSVPDALWFKIMSYIPFWTPTTTLVCITVGTVQWREIPLAIALMALAALTCARVSSRIYCYGVPELRPALPPETTHKGRAELTERCCFQPSSGR